MQDSLRARIGDTVRTRCLDTLEKIICSDTNAVMLFGSSRQSKTFRMLGFETVWYKQYVKGFGVSEIYYGSMGCVWGTGLRGCVINGIVYGDTTFIVGIIQIGTEIPSEFQLYQNYPNPFNPATKIRFDIPSGFEHRTSNIELVVYDILGRVIATLVSEPIQPGTYEAIWDATNFPSGVYYYRLTAGDFSETKKMILAK